MTNHIATSFTISKKTLETFPMPTIIKAIIGIKSTINQESVSAEYCLSEGAAKDGMTLKFFTGLPDEDNNAILKAFAAGDGPYDVIQALLDQYKNTENIRPWHGDPNDDDARNNKVEDENQCLRCCNAPALYIKRMTDYFLENDVTVDTNELIEDFKRRFYYKDNDLLIVALQETELHLTPSRIRCTELKELLVEIEESMRHCADVSSAMSNGSPMMHRMPYNFPDAYEKAEYARARELCGNTYEYNLYYNLMESHNKISIHLARAGVKDVCLLDYNPA